MHLRERSRGQWEIIEGREQRLDWLLEFLFDRLPNDRHGPRRHLVLQPRKRGHIRRRHHVRARAHELPGLDVQPFEVYGQAVEILRKLGVLLLPALGPRRFIQFLHGALCTLVSEVDARSGACHAQ